MIVNRNINNVDELRAEIARLELLQQEQEGYLNDQLDLLKDKIASPIHWFKKATSWIPNLSKSQGPAYSANHPQADWLTNSLRVALPFVLNKVLFPKAGFIKKALLVFASQKAASVINQDRISGIVDKITSLIRPPKPTPVNNKMRDYGIPPDSETY